MPAIRTINVTCPSCQTILVVNRDTGEVVEERKPLVENPSGDRFADALRAQGERSKKLTAAFTESLSSAAQKEEERRKLFEETLKKAREDKSGKPAELRDIDLD